MKPPLASLGVLALAATTVGAAETPLYDGVPRVDQTGRLGSSQAGKCDREHAHARAIVLDSGKARSALIAHGRRERISSMSATIKAVAGAVNCPNANVLITHTHTHSATSAPMTFGGAGRDAIDPATRKWTQGSDLWTLRPLRRLVFSSSPSPTARRLQSMSSMPCTRLTGMCCVWFRVIFKRPCQGMSRNHSGTER